MDEVELPIQNAIYLFVTTEIIELFLYIRKTGGLVLMVVKMSTPDPCHYVKKKLYSSSSFSIKLNTLRCSSIRSYLEGVSNTSGHFMLMSLGCGPHCARSVLVLPLPVPGPIPSSGPFLQRPGNVSGPKATFKINTC